MTDNYVILITSDSFGKGDKTLGKKLMDSYLYTLTEADQLPTHILFLNSGVNLVTNDSNSLDNLKALEDKRVTLMACGICVEYFSLEEKVAVGNIGNMYSNMELMSEADKVITIC
ncbi:sulfurtransferase-like selenium metabolism protein YedF [Natranaerobius thermophilus]|uniref:Uncharacterized protein n=1 Tax=Natranaerobius thermophilus (strain ATCC BAA-1301 / DSM 18059 / JW/NM-WN-LF) TaxID=457570 RepID=B2A7W7_NATTJ|nr:sulfurtransferase-like selenium metabolism protein YedF [Natranaerobius thermophilus]ACB84415.1 conserved hypothetical protein [Natranaerobius thermophilus JW/NM-WN-LF]